VTQRWSLKQTGGLQVLELMQTGRKLADMVRREIELDDVRVVFFDQRDEVVGQMLDVAVPAAQRKAYLPGAGKGNSQCHLCLKDFS
jgi:hypothetical protein